MATDKRLAERHLKEMLMAMNNHRNHRAAYSHNGDAAGVERCERALKLNHSLIRAHCAKHCLKRPHDVPSEGAE